MGDESRASAGPLVTASARIAGRRRPSCCYCARSDYQRKRVFNFVARQIRNYLLMLSPEVRGKLMLKKALFRFAFYTLLSYGFFYFSYKYYVPDFGGTDFYEYYSMYLQPLHFDVAKSSWIYRQLSALVVHFIWKLGVFYDTTISFSREGFDKRVFFAAILSNYIALICTAVVSAFATDAICRDRNEWCSITAGMLCFFGFFAQPGVLTGLTEGLSWLLVSIGFLGYVMRSFIPICVVLCLSVFQRETIPIVFGVFSAVGLIFHRGERRLDGVVLLCSLTSFATYIFIRSVLIPVTGNEDQISPSAILSSLEIWQTKVTKDFIFQALLSQNLLILLATMWAVLATSRAFKSRPDLPWAHTSEISVFLSAFSLIVVGFAAGIQVNNIGRVLAILTPIVSSLLARNLASLIDSSHSPVTHLQRSKTAF